MAKRNDRDKPQLCVALRVADSGRLTARQEMVVANTIVYEKGGIAASAAFLGIPQSLVSEVFLKYSAQISQALVKGLDDDRINEAINGSVRLLERKIKSLKGDMAANGDLTADQYGECLAAVDRLVKVKSASSDAYCKCLSGLTADIVKAKLAEKVEEGIDFDNSVYASNQKAVADLLRGGELKPSKDPECGVHAYDLAMGAEHCFSSRLEFCRAAGITMPQLDEAIEAAAKIGDDAPVIGSWRYLGSDPEIVVSPKGK